jgi:hypothetical protein
MWYDGTKDGTKPLSTIISSNSGDNIDFESALLLIVDPRERLRDSDWEGYQLKVTLFDVIGNEILSYTKGESTDNCKAATAYLNNRLKYVFAWDGRNSRGRRVGSGAYLAIFSLKRPNGTVLNIRKTVMVPAVK